MRKLTVLAAFVALAAVCAGSAMGSIAISVDVSKPIGVFNPLCRDFAQGGESADPEYLKPLIRPMRALKPRLIRFDHVMNHFAKASVKDGRVTVDFSALDTQLDIIRAMGAQPLMCIAFNPAILGETTSPPNDLKVWEDLVYRLVKHVNGERKLGVEYWEIWNEPNLNVFWKGSLAQFLELYRVTEKAVLGADPSVKFGGAGFYSLPADWARAMMEHAKTNKLRMDFISWHDYSGGGRAIGGDVANARAWMKQLGLNSEIIIDEWNHDAKLNPGNDNHNAAVHIANMLCTMAELGVDYAPFFEIKDGSGEKRYWGRWGLFTADHHPKASYYAFLGFANMAGSRLSFSVSRKLPGDEVVAKAKAPIGGMAVGAGKRFDVVLYNTSKKQDETVDLVVSGLRKSAVAARVFLIDESHSNPALTGRDAGLEQVDKQTLLPKNGTARIKVWLPKRSVAFVLWSAA